MPPRIKCSEAADDIPRRIDTTRGNSEMQTIQEVNPEQLAKLFHYYHEALQKDCDSEVDGFSWDRASQSKRKLMIAAARLALLDLSTTAAAPNPHRKYYAKPGEADWGC